MFDLSFYKLIKWRLNLEDDLKEQFHKKIIARTLTRDMFKYSGFSLLVMLLNINGNTNTSNFDRYIEDYYEYFKMEFIIQKLVSC